MTTIRTALCALAVLLTATGCAAASAAPLTTQRIAVAYADGAPIGGVQQVTIPLGSPVELVFTSDVAEDLHLHGYHHHVVVPAGGTGSVVFTADVPGVFEAEAESVHVPLARLQVG